MAYLKRDDPGSGECIFCAKINSKDDDAHHVLHRGAQCFVTLNLYPYNNGHLMVVPYRHVPTLQELSNDELADLMIVTQQALRVLQQAYRPQGYNIGINQGQAAGAGIASHLHQHIVPRWNGDTNYLTVVGETRTIPEWIDEAYVNLRAIWDSAGASSVSNKG